jgi:hypothetical protein
MREARATAPLRGFLRCAQEAQVECRRTCQAEKRLVRVAWSFQMSEPKHGADPAESRLEGLRSCLSRSFRLDAFNGLALDGTWTINVSDHAGGDTGSLVGVRMA